MADTEEYVMPPTNVGFERQMVDATAPVESEPLPFLDVQDAASVRPLPEDTIEPTKVEYFKVKDGEATGEHSDPDEAVTPEQAARNLADWRNSRADAQERQVDDLSAQAIDYLRARRAGVQPEVQVQPQEPQVQVQPEVQAQP